MSIDIPLFILLTAINFGFVFGRSKGEPIPKINLIAGIACLIKLITIL